MVKETDKLRSTGHVGGIPETVFDWSTFGARRLVCRGGEYYQEVYGKYPEANPLTYDCWINPESGAVRLQRDGYHFVGRVVKGWWKLEILTSLNSVRDPNLYATELALVHLRFLTSRNIDIHGFYADMDGSEPYTANFDSFGSSRERLREAGLSAEESAYVAVLSINQRATLLRELGMGRPGADDLALFSPVWAAELAEKAGFPFPFTLDFSDDYVAVKYIPNCL